MTRIRTISLNEDTGGHEEYWHDTWHACLADLEPRLRRTTWYVTVCGDTPTITIVWES